MFRRPLHLSLVLAVAALLCAGALTQAQALSPPEPASDPPARLESTINSKVESTVESTVVSPVTIVPSVVTAACSGGPTIDGILLDECVDRTFTIGTESYTVRVYYTKNQTPATRSDGSGGTLTLQHWINTDTEAATVAQWGENAWRRYHSDSGHHPYIKGCSNRLTIQLEDGVGWAGVAYWASSGRCVIGIDSPMIRNGWGESVVYHEVGHYVQYSYDAGCYANLKAHYDGGSDAGNAEFVEGYADLSADSVNSTVDALCYNGASYDPSTSFYDKNYNDIFSKYFVEQLGSSATTADPWHHMDAMYAHYAACDVADNLYVLDTLVPSLSGGRLSDDLLFLNFFAANWARQWADHTTQPALRYFDDDGANFGNTAPLRQDVSMATGTQSWADSTPDDYAARYYQVRPQTGCPYLQMEVDGAPGAFLGINLMAAKTSAPTRVLRSAWVGNTYERTFAAAGTHERLVAVVNSFAHNYNYTVRFTCVTPALQILQPLSNPGFAQVGSPAAPITFLSRFQVLNGSAAVRGLQESSFTYFADSDTMTATVGSFQAVGDQYWVVLQAPVKPAGTTFVDLKVCLDGTFCDTKNDALLYVEPGKSDVALVFDASGSMSTEDTLGEGTRLVNAQKAGGVVADLLRAGDRIYVMDFSAFNNPPGCGLPGGTGNCPLDLRELMARQDVVIPATIAAAKSAINGISAREWTPISEALVFAKNRLLAAPYSLNPKYIYLLSDGEENVRRLYVDLRNELRSSGVIINTIGFGPDAPGNLLAQMAADSGGVYRPVPTTPSGAGVSAAQLDELRTAGIPEELLAVMAAPVQPGQLGLADVYDYFDTTAQEGSRLLHFAYPNAEPNVWQEQSIYVDRSVSELRLVVAGKEPDTFCDYRREVGVMMPGGKYYIPVSPPSGDPPAPPTWQIRNDPYEDVVIIPHPEAGIWKVRSKAYVTICAADGTESEVAQVGDKVSLMINASVQSTFEMQGFLLGLTDNQGNAGDPVTIIGVPLSRAGTVKGAFVVALVEGPTGSHLMVLRDDGHNGDGSAADGIYGKHFAKTALGGGYSVRISGLIQDPADPAKWFLREWNGGFWIKGPRLDEPKPNPDDLDGDGLPDPWERNCQLDPRSNDAGEDPDHDGLSNAEELQNGTLPCRADTDNGGEKDKSEITHARDPLYPNDDKVRKLDYFDVRPLNQRVRINWSHAVSYTRAVLYYSITPDQLGKSVEMGQSGEYLLGGLTNNQRYYFRMVPFGEANSEGDMSHTVSVTPMTDTDPPSGAILIERRPDGTIASTQVMLLVDSTDIPVQGMPQGANAGQTDMLSLLYNTVSGGVQVRYSNDPTLAGASYEAIVSPKAWTLACNEGQVCTVYAQFRDALGNQSSIIHTSAILNPLKLYLPIINR